MVFRGVEGGGVGIGGAGGTPSSDVIGHASIVFSFLSRRVSVEGGQAEEGERGARQNDKEHPSASLRNRVSL